MAGAGDNPSTQQNYVLDASPVALGLGSGERVTEFMVSFGIVPLEFPAGGGAGGILHRQQVADWRSQVVNQADVGGVHNGQWIMATTRWVTRIHQLAKPCPVLAIDHLMIMSAARSLGGALLLGGTYENETIAVFSLRQYSF